MGERGQQAAEGKFSPLLKGDLTRSIPNMKLFLVFCVLVVTGAANQMDCPPCECHCHFNVNEQMPEQTTTTYWPDYTTTTTPWQPAPNCRAGAEPCTNGDQCCSGNCSPSDEGNVCAPEWQCVETGGECWPGYTWYCCSGTCNGVGGPNDWGTCA